MTLTKIPENLGMGGAHLNKSVLRAILVELQEKLTALQTSHAALDTKVTTLASLSTLSQQAARFKTTVVAGAAAATDVPVTGIKTGDRLMVVIKLDFTLADGAPNTRTWDTVDLLSEASITSDGNIQLSTTDTTGAALLVSWLDLT